MVFNWAFKGLIEDMALRRWVTESWRWRWYWWVNAKRS